MRDAAINIRGIPSAISRAVLQDAKHHDRSVNDVVGEILGDPATGSAGSPPAGVRAGPGRPVAVRMPAVLKHTIQAHADAIGGKQTGCVLLALAQHYGVEAPSVKVRRVPPESPLAKKLMNEVRKKHQGGQSIRSLEREYGLTRGTLNRALRPSEAHA